MGTWGAGNLENDYALDELCDRSAKLVEAMMDRARGKRSREGDEYDYTTLFVEFEIVFALEAKGLLMGRLPEPDDVEELKLSFIQDWEVYYEEMAASPEHLKKRRQCIMRTFNRFKRICTKHKEAGWPG